jgi:hypothetical protein
VERWFRDSYKKLQQEDTIPMDTSRLRPWAELGRLQGRVHPDWEAAITTFQLTTWGKKATTAATIQQLLRASLEAWYQAIWLPRCQRTTERERNEGLHQGAKLRRMRAARRVAVDAPPSPTPTLPDSYIHTVSDRRDAHCRFLSMLMHGTDRR